MGVPYHRGKVTFPVQAGAAGHSDWGNFPQNASDRVTQRRRQETITNTKVYQRHKGCCTHPGIRRYQESEMVGGRGICGPPRHEEPHRRDDVDGARFPVFRIKQTKLNTKSSTEAELVGVDDLMNQILWMHYFLEAQVMKVSDNVVYQDNQSEMKLEKNRRASSGKRTRYINTCYFFVTDRIQENEMKVDYCPT